MKLELTPLYQIPTVKKSVLDFPEATISPETIVIIPFFN
ncbi:hypothetical protein HDF26_000747 [Pedobacter cryoconitis]|nr:hypothetical protein [Pedobacter cryoconitis]